MSATTHLVFKMLAVIAVVVVGTVVAQDFEITHSTVDGGGDKASCSVGKPGTERRPLQRQAGSQGQEGRTGGVHVG